MGISHIQRHAQDRGMYIYIEKKITLNIKLAFLGEIKKKTNESNSSVRGKWVARDIICLSLCMCL